ncbi:hypothetical protein BOTBODRAFT_34144 [Botryobasidium botryosum FD-172 SS1]|uniref:Uncharacterized protein n=1 Tax=Botryobasidium botryosum (strain FD-172 SS1) TaxID=930990 RepID=A0A067MAS9_BOTB1|nr:hypothetical protein BOTBODRAFT_34144 [Botryobasidium botryosum FD-172 SS1]
MLPSPVPDATTPLSGPSALPPSPKDAEMEGNERSESSAGSESDTRSDMASDSEYEWSPQTSVLVSLPAPTIDAAKQVLASIKRILKPPPIPNGSTASFYHS